MNFGVRFPGGTCSTSAGRKPARRSAARRLGCMCARPWASTGTARRPPGRATDRRALRPDAGGVVLTRIFVPRDAAALAVGADEVAAALAGHADVVRTGSRGLFWLEPMIEVETPDGRIAYGPVEATDIPALLDDGLLTATAQHLRLGIPEQIPFLARQTRLTFSRCGIVDPLSLDDYRAHGGLGGLDKARSLGPAGIIAAVMASGLRGRGGAGFPTAV